MKKNNRETGNIYEKQAAAYLQNNGYDILEQNFRCKLGEIDLIAQKDNTLVFCEVKYRSSEAKGHPFEAVDRKKQEKIIKTAYYYLTYKRGEIPACRFDVIGILKEEIIHVENAFVCEMGYF